MRGGARVVVTTRAPVRPSTLGDYLRLIVAVLRPPSGEVTRTRFGLMTNVLAAFGLRGSDALVSVRSNTQAPAAPTVAVPITKPASDVPSGRSEPLS
jgi:hypothetical protein